jgi:hypothetical protein
MRRAGKPSKRLSEKDSDTPIRPKVRPPLPAPYLAGAPCLSDPLSLGSRLSYPDEQLDNMPLQRVELQRQIRDLKRTLRDRRKNYEDVHGVEIDPEKPLAD